MDNRRKFNIGQLMTVIVLIGVLLSFVSELPMGEILGGMETTGSLEGFLDNLNMVLMFLVFAGLIIWLFVRAIRNELPKKYQDWDD